MAAGKHPFPFRTRQLSPPAPMVLGGRPPGRVGRRRDFYDEIPSELRLEGISSIPGSPREPKTSLRRVLRRHPCEGTTKERAVQSTDASEHPSAKSSRPVGRDPVDRRSRAAARLGPGVRERQAARDGREHVRPAAVVRAGGVGTAADPGAVRVRVDRRAGQAEEPIAGGRPVVPVVARGRPEAALRDLAPHGRVHLARVLPAPAPRSAVASRGPGETPSRDGAAPREGAPDGPPERDRREEVQAEGRGHRARAGSRDEERALPGQARKWGNVARRGAREVTRRDDVDGSETGFPSVSPRGARYSDDLERERRRGTPRPSRPAAWVRDDGARDEWEDTAATRRRGRQGATKSNATRATSGASATEAIAALSPRHTLPPEYRGGHP